MRLTLETKTGFQTFMVPRKEEARVLGLLEFLTPIDGEGAFVASDDKSPRPGTVLRRMRTKARLTQTQLGEKLKVTPGNVSAMESGRRPIGRGMARRLGVILKTDYRVFL